MSSTGEIQTLSANGTTVFKKYSGPIHLSLTGGFGGGTAKLQTKDPNGDIIDVADASWTDVTNTLFDYPENSINSVAVNLAGATGPSLKVWVQGQFAGDDA